MSYDYTVLAGTQGTQNHRKKDRLFELAEQLRLPIVFLTEGGGGRPGDTDGIGVSGLDCLAFRWFGELSGTVPLVGVNAGYCFAGNAAILGCCDVVIATEDSNIGMGGPAMIEGGGLGLYEPTEIGPIEVQRANGVVDIVVADEAAAIAAAKQYLSYFQGRTLAWEAAPDEEIRNVVPVDRLRAYDMHRAIDALFDVGSVLELRREFGVGMITALGAPRRSAGRCGRQQSDPPRRCDRFRRCRQGGPVPAAVRRVLPADRHARRHAGDDGRPGRRGHGARAPLQPAVRHRCERVGAHGVDRDAQGVRARRAGDDGRFDEGTAGVSRLADRRVRRHGVWRAPSGSDTARSSRPRSTTRHATRCSGRWSTGCTSTARR